MIETHILLILLGKDKGGGMVRFSMPAPNVNIGDAHSQ